jgi:hypothetical protein
MDSRAFQLALMAVEGKSTPSFRVFLAIFQSMDTRTLQLIFLAMEGEGNSNGGASFAMERKEVRIRHGTQVFSSRNIGNISVDFPFCQKLPPFAPFITRQRS